MDSIIFLIIFSAFWFR